MTFDEADRIVSLWAKHLEFRADMLQCLFVASIPKAFLPATAADIERALNIAIKAYRDAGDYEAAGKLATSFGQLMFYTDDDAGLQGLAFKLSDARYRQTVVDGLSALRNKIEGN